MTFTEYTLDNTPINARIAHCAAQMYLARIEPQRPGHVRWSSSKSTSTDEETGTSQPRLQVCTNRLAE